MSEVTKEDISNIHERIDDLIKAQNDANVIVAGFMARIDTKLEDMPRLPERPCIQLKEHLHDHKETKATWQKPIVATFIGLIKMGIVAFFTWLIVK